MDEMVLGLACRQGIFADWTLNGLIQSVPGHVKRRFIDAMQVV